MVGVTTMDKKQLVKLVSSFSMADGGLYKRSPNGNAYFMMNMLTEHMDYIEWVQDTLEHLTKTSVSKIKNPYKNPQTRICSRTLPFFTKIHGRVYKGNYKSLDPHALKMLDWEMLSIFHMADGCLYVEQPNPKKGLVNHSPNISLNMKRLSYGDIWFLKKTIKDRLGIEYNIGQQNYRGKTYYFLRLRNKDVKKFSEGVLPYTCPSFYYKVYDSVRKAPVQQDDDIV